MRRSVRPVKKPAFGDSFGAVEKTEAYGLSIQCWIKGGIGFQVFYPPTSLRWKFSHDSGDRLCRYATELAKIHVEPDM